MRYSYVGKGEMKSEFVGMLHINDIDEDLFEDCTEFFGARKSQAEIVEAALEPLFGPIVVQTINEVDDGEMVSVLLSNDQAKLFARVMREVSRQVLGECDE